MSTEDKDLQKQLKKSEKQIYWLFWATKLFISAHPKNFQKPTWISVCGYIMMVSWLCLPFLALIFSSLLLFKIFVGILTLMAIEITSDKPIKAVKKASEVTPAQIELAPEMKGSVDYQEFINMTWARQKQCWDAGEKITLNTAAARVALDNLDLYNSALIFIRKQRNNRPSWNKPTKIKKPEQGGKK